MSLLKAIKAQLGLSNTPANNFTITAEADNGTLKLARGNAGATTQDILTVDASGRMSHGVPMGGIFFVGTGGFGVTDTAIRRFATAVHNQVTDVSFTDTAANGTYFTINKSGVYAISYSDCFTGQAHIGVSRNSTERTSPINGITSAHALIVSATAGPNMAGSCSTTVRLNAGDIIRAHTGTGLVPGSGANPTFTITRIA